MPADLLISLLRNLQAQGILHVLSGIVAGEPAFREKGESYKAVFHQVIAEEARLRDLPILWKVNAGHAYPTGVFRWVCNMKLTVKNRGLRLLEKASE